MSLIYQIFFLFVLLVNAALAGTSSQSELISVYHAIKNRQIDLLQDQALSIQSKITDTRLSAEVYAVNKYAYSEIVQKLSQPSQWCGFITLHLNIKACTYQLEPELFLSLYAGRKFYEAAEDAYELRYQFKVEKLNEKFFKLSLTAEEGPFGTEDYLIVLEILKVGHETLLHMSLSYQTSLSSRLGTTVYLSTIGADKVGFSKVTDEHGVTGFIAGMEGIIERNVMRYFLALTTYLDYSAQPLVMPKQWFLSTEKYSRQLHEVELADYLAAKKKEFEQQKRMQKNIIAGNSIFETL